LHHRQSQTGFPLNSLLGLRDGLCTGGQPAHNPVGLPKTLTQPFQNFLHRICNFQRFCGPRGGIRSCCTMTASQQLHANDHIPSIRTQAPTTAGENEWRSSFPTAALGGAYSHGPDRDDRKPAAKRPKMRPQPLTFSLLKSPTAPGSLLVAHARLTDSRCTPLEFLEISCLSFVFVTQPIIPSPHLECLSSPA
jgi:hypothetical protein